jgi:hypothetical protein
MTNLFKNRSRSALRSYLQTALIILIMAALAVGYTLFEARQ